MSAKEPVLLSLEVIGVNTTPPEQHTKGRGLAQQNIDHAQVFPDL